MAKRFATLDSLKADAAKAAPAASPQKRTHMAPTTAYSDIDGVGADPWKLAELLGFNGAAK